MTTIRKLGAHTMNPYGSGNCRVTLHMLELTDYENGTFKLKGRMYVTGDYGDPSDSVRAWLTGDKSKYWALGDVSLIEGRSINFETEVLDSKVYAISDGNKVKSITLSMSRGGPSNFKEYIFQLNQDPVITDTTENNKTFYEQDTINLNGSITDSDSGNIMSVKYKINNGTTRAIATAISDGTTPIAYSKTLKYTNGKLLDGDTEIATGLVDGQTYEVTIWAEDDQGGKSTEVVRNFTAVPNRPPVLSIDPINPQTDKINSELLTLNGEVTDPEGNDVVVSLRINENTSKQIYSGVPSTFTTDIKISDLIEGNNTLTITAKDTFDFVTTKTVTIKKTRNATKLNKAIARYKVNPPSGSAKQILAWVQKEIGDLIVDADVSMVLAGENESYNPMAKTTAPIDDLIEEDEFSHEVATEKDNITLKLKLSKTDVNSTKSIKQISGVLK